MKKNATKIIPVIILTAIFILPVMSVFAEEADKGVTPDSGSFDKGVTSNPSVFTLQNPLKVNSVGAAVYAFIEIFTYVVILFAVLMFIYVGFQYILNAAQGNAAKIKDLHKQLMWLVIGVAVVIAARVIVQVVINTLEAAKVANPEVIQRANNAVQGR